MPNIMDKIINKIIGLYKKLILYKKKISVEKFITDKRFIVGFVIILFFLIVTFYVLSKGKASLYETNQEQLPVLETKEEELVETLEEKEVQEWEDGWIRYQGDVYAYNDDILTFLVIGIDKRGGFQEVTDSTSGGQSDAMFLAVCNPRTEEIELIAINRNTMTEIEQYDIDGNFIGNVTAQIAVQYGYGDGKEISANRSVAAVSNLFYQLPIHGYCAINIEAIAEINDIIGGVEVEVLEDMTAKDSSLIEGTTVLLQGDMAYDYIQYRDVDTFDSASDRLERQKQYLVAFANQVKVIAKKDITAIPNLYNAIKEYMVTDVTLGEITYMASSMLNYQIDSENMHSMEGETVMGE
ncbi:MAG: LCP family protein, partial [Eubacteriales bacterium]